MAATALLLGRSELGAPIHAYRIREPSSHRRVLVVGCIHGTECAAIRLVDQLRRTIPVSELWLVPNLNPDGLRRGVRQNGRGVDLNRNFGSEWRPRGRRWDPEYPGQRPWSERETRIARRLIERIQPDVTIWYHQPQGLVRAWSTSVPEARRYARAAGEPFRAIRWPRGTAPNWQNHRFPSTMSFVVELPSGQMTRGALARHQRAVLTLTRAQPRLVSARDRGRRHRSRRGRLRCARRARCTAHARGRRGGSLPLLSARLVGDLNERVRAPA